MKVWVGSESNDKSEFKFGSKHRSFEPILMARILTLFLFQVINL